MKSKIKIAHVLHSVGGVDVSLRLILENIDNDKFENIIVHGIHDTNVNFVDKIGDKVLNYRITIFRDISFFNDIKALMKTYTILKKERPDLIHAHSAKGGVIGRIVGKLLGIKVLYTPQAFSYLSTQNKVKRLLFLLIERTLIFNNNVLLASSDSEKERAINEVGYPENKTLVFNNCVNEIVNTEELKIKKTWPDNYICTVGRPSFQKNIELMIGVFNELNKSQKTHLVVMGVGHHVGQLESVKKMINDLKMQADVTLLEWTNRSDVFNIIKNSKLYISTARYEGLPYSIIESLALSKPCVVSDCDGNRDLIKEGYNGFVIKNEDIKEYSVKILKLLNDKDMLEQLSKNAYKSFSDNFNMSKNIQNLEKIYESYIYDFKDVKR